MAAILKYIPLALAGLLFGVSVVQIGLSGYLVADQGLEPDPLWVAEISCAVVIALLLIGSVFLPGLKPISSTTTPRGWKIILNICIWLVIVVLAVLNVAMFNIEHSFEWSDDDSCRNFSFYDGGSRCGIIRAIKGLTVVSLGWSVTLLVCVAITAVQLRKAGGRAKNIRNDSV